MAKGSKYVVKCPECGSHSISFEDYLNHVFSSHPDKPSLRVRGKVTRLVE